MLILLLVYAIFQSGLGDAVSTPLVEPRDPCSCGEPIQTRSVWNIIWSCLSTIFLCTWVSLHPNISSIPEEPGLSWFEKRIRNPLVEFLTYKLPLFFWALLVPEYILAWAIRQYIIAGKVQKKVPSWTRAHGFFLIMGGFQLFERSDRQKLVNERYHMTPNFGRFVRILELKDMDQHELETIVPLTSEAEIKDRGKSDGIAKFIVLFQTSWFVIQCIARGIEHLPLTELEIVTLAYSMMNFFVYIFWWDKPRDVGCPIRVYTDLTRTDVEAEWESGVFGIFERVASYALGLQDRYLVLSEECKVPMFWSGGVWAWDSDTPGIVSMRATLGPSILGIAFGAIHCIAWSYVFPSHVELFLWRASCVAMMVVPLLSTIACAANSEEHSIFALVIVFFVCLFLLALSSWLYIVARIATIVMAFTTLRSLPSEAFTVVDWTTFIPHI